MPNPYPPLLNRPIIDDMLSCSLSCQRLPQAFYQRDSITVARALLGQKLVRVHRGKRLAGMIVETEAYLGMADQAAHTYKGRRTTRNQSMWQAGGIAYVYFTYGMHFCVNVVAGDCDQPIAVLIRALEPLEGLEQMYQNRIKARKDQDLCSGPAKLCQALAIDRKLDGVHLITSSHLFLEKLRDRTYQQQKIGVSPRIGIPNSGLWKDKPLRFFIRRNSHVSRPS